MPLALIIDQFETPDLRARQEGIPWQEFVDYHLHERNAKRAVWQTRAKLMEVPDDYKPEWATSVFVEKDGMVELWKYRWDSSG